MPIALGTPVVPRVSYWHPSRLYHLLFPPMPEDLAKLVYDPAYWSDAAKKF
ncbi:hypothetical protein M422DRAFT_29143, partial [Sphaerobolus stellatus SS14]